MYISETLSQSPVNSVLLYLWSAQCKNTGPSMLLDRDFSLERQITRVGRVDTGISMSQGPVNSVLLYLWSTQCKNTGLQYYWTETSESVE